LKTERGCRLTAFASELETRESWSKGQYLLQSSAPGWNLSALGCTLANPPQHTEAAAKPGCMMAVIFGAIIGASVSGIIFVSGLHFTWNIKSGDFLTTVLAALGVMLAATSVMIAVVALALAVFGFYGYEKIKDIVTGNANKSASAIAALKVDDYLKNIDPELRSRAISILNQEIGNLNLGSATRRSTQAAGAAAADEGDETFPIAAIEAAQAEELQRQAAALEAVEAAEQALVEREGGDEGGDYD
jgi:hypothetical protein